MGRRPGPNRKAHRDTEWMDDAACRNAPKDLLHPVPPEEWPAADRTPERTAAFFRLVDTVIEDYCVGCPVRAACRSYGADENYGIWGGLSEHDRRAGFKTHRRYRDPDAKTPVLTRAVTAILRRRQARYLERLGIA